MTRRIYLDHAATTPVDPRVAEAMRPHLGEVFGNPSSVHAEGRAARRALESAREHVAALIGAEPAEIVFCSGATEANNWALAAGLARGRRRVVSAAVEHPSILEACRAAAETGADVVLVPPDAAGVIGAEAFASAAEGAGVAALAAVNHETGAVQPVAAVAAACERAGVPLHVDAAQAPGRVAFDVRAPGVATAALSAHKIGGPKGVGALWVRREHRLAPLFRGGPQERGRRAGTENVAGVVGFGEAARLLASEREERFRRLRELDRAFREALLAAGARFVLRGPEGAQRAPGLMTLGFGCASGETLLVQLDLNGVAASLGSACASGAVEASPVLLAMGVSKGEALASLRFSLGATNTPDEVEHAARLISRLLQPKT